MSDNNTITREYIDNYSVKELMSDTIVPEYFDDQDISMRTIGMIGYTTELVTNCTEDSFNASSVLFRESFANRAQMSESIYSHAAIFQIDDVFAKASCCRFLLVLEEAAIIKNMTQSKQGSSIYNFFIDKNTTIYIEDLPYTLDYDIRLNIVKKSSDKKDDYIFTAEYIMDEYLYGNSISEISDPYVKLRRSNDGFIALEITAHQCIRDIRYETIVSNSTLNYPVIELSDFNGKLAGFEVLYNDPSKKYAKNGPVQIQKKIIYSNPLTVPFCYYQMIDSNTLRITFNTKDLYFMPEFNSDLTIILYVTNGEDGNFDVYNGTNISLIPNNEKYNYANSYLTAAKPIGSSVNGSSTRSEEEVQSLAVEGYRTANALTTDHDLQQFFNNYKYRYNDLNILFIKKRDDVYERVFSAFLVMQNNQSLFKYKTNTLNLKFNLYDMKNPEKDVYMLDPGCLFTANDTSGYAEFFRDEEKSNDFYNQYQQAISDGTTNFILDTVDQDEVPAYLKRPCSFAQFKSRHNLDDKKYVFDLIEDDYEKYDNPTDNKFLLMNPFLIRFTKSPNLISTYMTYVTNSSVLDFTNQNDDTYVQFITYMLNIKREFAKDKIYNIDLSVTSSIGISQKYPIIKSNGTDEQTKETIYNLNDIYSLSENDLRIFMIIKDGSKNICYTELYPSEFESEGNLFKFKGEIQTDDHITSKGYLRILPNTIYRNRETGEYYKVYDNDKTLYNKYNAMNDIIETDVPVDVVTNLTNTGVLYKFSRVINMTLSDDILIPLTDVTCEIYTLYKRHYSQANDELIENTEYDTNNILINYDDSLNKYVWTNEYLTAQEPITFIKPLDSVRSYLTFEDYTAASQNDDGEIIFKNDIYDAQMTSVGFLRALTYTNSDKMDYFMKLFNNTYEYITDIIKNQLRNATNIDVKFYNTYGKSKNFLIGEQNEVLDTVNLSLYFDMWFVAGTDTTVVMPEVKAFIKKEVENVNDKGMNNLFISNLMRKVELQFAYIDHIRFNKINMYDSTYQAVKNNTTDLNTLSVEERRFYVPELLVCDIDNIHITEYYAQ